MCAAALGVCVRLFKFIRIAVYVERRVERLPTILAYQRSELRRSVTPIHRPQAESITA